MAYVAVGVIAVAYWLACLDERRLYPSWVSTLVGSLWYVAALLLILSTL